MSKKYSIFISALFCVFVGGFMALMLVTPDRDFSPTENRSLSSFPTLRARDFELAWPIRDSGDFFTGKWMSKFETYVTDQFPGRDSWISAKAMSETLLGKHENNGIYIGEDTLIPRFDEPNHDLILKNLDYVNQLVANTNVPVYFGLIPGKVTVWEDRLPNYAPNADEMAIIELAQSSTDANWMDVAGILLEHSHEDLYYRLDHHWTSLGAYYGYCAMMESMGKVPVDLADYEKITVSDSFDGTAFSSSGVRWMESDVIDIYIPEENLVVTSQTAMEPEDSTLYVWDKLEEKDKYAFFLGGNQSLGKIVTEHTDAPKVLVIRDSFSDGLAPFLTENFSEIHLFDARYNKNSLRDYIARNRIDEVVVLYSVVNFVGDSNLFVLGM